MGNRTIYGETEYLRKYTVIKSLPCLESGNGGQIVVGRGWLHRARAAQSGWHRVRRNPLWGFRTIPATSLANSQQQLALKPTSPIRAGSEVSCLPKTRDVKAFCWNYLAAGSGRVDSPTWPAHGAAGGAGHSTQGWQGNEDYMLIFRQREIARENIKAN